jgi:hypothetical protein
VLGKRSNEGGFSIMSPGNKKLALSTFFVASTCMLALCGQQADQTQLFISPLDGSEMIDESYLDKKRPPFENNLILADRIRRAW